MIAAIFGASVRAVCGTGIENVEVPILNFKLDLLFSLK